MSTDIRYTEDHEWVSTDGAVATIGITAYAQEQLGDVVFVELPEIGKKVSQGGEAAVIESVKAAAELYAPADGEIVEVNTNLGDDPSLVNSSPTDMGWFVKIKLSDPSQIAGLMDEGAYKTFLEELS